MPAALVDVLKALGNPTRLQIMEWLRTPEESFEEYEPIADRQQFGVCVTHLAVKGRPLAADPLDLHGLPGAGWTRAVDPHRQVGSARRYPTSAAGWNGLITGASHRGEEPTLEATVDSADRRSWQCDRLAQFGGGLGDELGEGGVRLG